MGDDDILDGSLLDESWLTLEQIAAACQVDSDWLQHHIDEGFFPELQCVAGIWRLPDHQATRIRRVREIERDFEALPELAALVADLLEKVDELRGELRRAALR